MIAADANGRLRLDKWLWAARFFKTRSLAAAAVDGGKVKVNELPTKAAKEIKAGDRLDLTVGEAHWQIIVVAVNDQRRPAAEARLLYQETPESLARRLREQEEKALAPTPGADLRGRPTKKDRRQIHRFFG
jgi:ribosome-associated heat shock protein Hsp15